MVALAKLLAPGGRLVIFCKKQIRTSIYFGRDNVAGRFAMHRVKTLLLAGCTHLPIRVGRHGKDPLTWVVFRWSPIGAHVRWRYEQ